MRFESVTAHAFGPFRNRSLTLASGMNVVYGPNESGKSSWHAALQAGLCGAKNKKHGATKQEKMFKRQRKPWRGTDWDVEVLVALADGRRIELRQDLAAKAGQARDVSVAGQDYSAEINDGAGPNGARWLGLSRASFINTACVRQADMLGVREGANDLQDALAKAADKAGNDVTAAAALAQLENYRKNQIGTKQAPTRPLRRAEAVLADAKHRLDRARDSLEEHLRRQRDVKTLERQLVKQQGLTRGVRAHQAERVAKEANRRAKRVRELSRSLGNKPRIVTVEDADLANRVAAAIAAWESAPKPNEPLGDTHENLVRKQLAAQKERAILNATKPRNRPTCSTLLLGIALLAGAGICFWIQTTMMVLLGGVGAIAGLGTIVWALATAKRMTADRVRQVSELDGKLDSLKDQIERRCTEDLNYRNAVAQRQAAHEKLRQAGNAAGIRELAGNALVEALRGWQKLHLQRLARIVEETSMWDELQSERAGESPEEVERDANAKRKEADKLRQDCDAEGLNAALELVDSLPAQLQAERQLQARLDKAEGALEQFASGMASIADAEDDYEDAKRRLHHLKNLDQALEKATEFISQAQKGVYRDMAGVLRNTLLEWLPQVTGGRYNNCRVDPKTLLVEVREAQGGWRDASLLSHGTAEQIYLLLRLALCRHLVTEEETCPLILDDPVSACDSQRRVLVLETLLAISAETQVIVFTHDEDVRDWGHSHLSDANNSQVLELAGAESNEPAEHLGTRIANRFKGAMLTEPIEELRGASVRPLGIP